MTRWLGWESRPGNVLLEASLAVRRLGQGWPKFTDLREEDKLNQSLANKYFVLVDCRDSS